ncbi:MAG: Ig-like domain repeat protein [Nitrososphaerota archaeon]|nr:Ig-like domain repeat protein [Nitrososphaerota archaeon]
MRRATYAVSALLFLAVVALTGLAGASAVSGTTTTITGCTPSNSPSAGQTISCSATVSGSSPTGTLTWTTSGQGAFTPSNGQCTLVSGSCSISYTPTSTTATTLTATYSGDSSNNPSVSSPFAITVQLASPTLTLSCSPSTVVAGLSTTCTAQIVNGAPVDGTQVTFSSGGGTGTVSFPNGSTCHLASGVCSLVIAATGAGSATVKASYPGDANDNPASGTTTVTITKAAAITTVVCSPASVIAGDTTSCTATVKGYSPTGTVTWSSSDPNGVFSASSNPCTLTTQSSTTATCQVTYTAQSSATISGSYSGDGNNGPSVGTFAITATVNEQIQITVADSGPAATLSLSGCSVSPTTILADGQPQPFSATSGCSGIAVTLPPPQATARYLTSDGQSSLTIGACSSNSCQTFAATIYYQVLNTYQASPQSPAVWSTSGSIYVNGTALGTSGTELCGITVSTGSGQFSCIGWSDYGTQATMGALPVSATQRWATGSSAYSDTSGGNVHTSGYYLQILEYFQYSLVGSTTGPSAPSLTYTAFGAPAALPLVGSTSTVWLDSGTGWKVPVDLSGSTATERWQSLISTGAATAGQNVSLTYYHQYFVSFSYQVTGGGSGYTPPTVSFTTFGSPSSGNQTWVDAGSAYAFTDPLPGSTSTMRWESPAGAGVVSGAGTTTAVFYHQFAFALNFTVVDGGSFSSPSLSYVSTGAGASAPVNATVGTLWLDSGSSWSMAGLLPSSTPTERWVTDQAATGTVSGPLSEEFTYYHQYLAVIGYSVEGTGGSPPVPSLNFSALGEAQGSDLNRTASPLWVDAASTWTVPQTLPGVQGERWLANVTGPVQATAPFTVDVQYTHQFYVEVAASSLAGGSVGTPDQWNDQGATVLLSATAAPQWKLAYWSGGTPFSYNGTTALPTLTVAGPANETAVFYPSLTIASGDQGSVAYSFGSISGTVPAGSNATLYPPPGKNVTLTAQPDTVSIMFSGWSGALANSHIQSSLAVNSPSLVRASFGTDYKDIRTFVIATLAVLIGAAYVFVARRGYSPRKAKA